MAKLKVELNSKAVREMLKSPEMMSILQEQAEGLCAEAGKGYREYTASTRAVVVVAAATPEAEEDNMKNNTLLKALGRR